MKRLWILIFAGFLISTASAKAQETWDLQKLLNSAVANNAEVKKAALKQTESEYMKKEAIAHGLPQVDGKINYTMMGIPQINIPSDFAASLPQDLLPILQQLQGIDRLYTASAGVTASQLVYSQSYIEGIRQAKKAGELYDVMRQKTEDEVIYDVATLYYQIRNHYATLKILDENIQNLKKIDTILTLQYENDLAKKTDVQRVQVKIANLRTKKESLKDAIDIRERMLKIVCGIPTDTTLVVDTLSQHNELQSPVVSQFNVENLSDFQLLEKQEEMAQLKIKSDQADYFPNLAVFGQYNFSSYSTNSNFNLSGVTTVGFKATVPIFSSFLRHSKVMQAKIQLQEMQEDVSLHKKQLGTGYQHAANSLVSAWDVLQAQEENVSLARDVYHQVQLSFHEGMSSLTDLLSVESSLLEAESLYFQQLMRYQIAQLDMKKSTGNLQKIISTK
jgi:outer membrane protein TolC